MANCADLRVDRPCGFDLYKIFDCGQSFRFSPCGDSTFEGVALGMYLRISQTNDSIIFHDTDTDTYKRLWEHYFGLDTDYGEIQKDIIEHFGSDDTIKQAIKLGDGIRILRQDPWETLCTFILSQNNNIPRIRKLVLAISERFGDVIVLDNKKRVCDSENNAGLPPKVGSSVFDCTAVITNDTANVTAKNKLYYTFPSPSKLVAAGIDELRALSVGFRAPYLYDAANKITSGAICLDELKHLDTASLISALTEIKGVGPKVAACTALFGFGKFDAFPIDVWMKRVLNQYYPNGLDIASLGVNAGIAQQYLFYYQRYTVGK